MHESDLPLNLRFLCSYGRSVSDVCRKIGLNRQQFNQYLNGNTKPSLRTLRRICDFFGVEEHELFLPHRRFTEIVKLNPPKLEVGHSVSQEIVEAQLPLPKEAEKYVGYYRAYYQPDRKSGDVSVGLLSVKLDNGALRTQQIERYPNSVLSAPEVIKWVGALGEVDGRLVCFDREKYNGKSIATTYLYGVQYGSPRVISGLTMVISPLSKRSITAYRIVWEYLGKQIDLRREMRKCNSYSWDSEIMTPYIRERVLNSLNDSDSVFGPVE